MLKVYLDENISEYYFYKENDKWFETLKQRIKIRWKGGRTMSLFRKKIVPKPYDKDNEKSIINAGACNWLCSMIYIMRGDRYVRCK